MPSIEQVLWFIESEQDASLDLGSVAAHAGLSPFALSRLFSLATGWSVMRYIRARRLTRAAHALGDGTRDILQVALDAGYGSHEAFTRAFSDLFGVTPRQVREQGHGNLHLVEPLRMKAMSFVELSEPRFETRPDFLIAGLGERFTFDRNEGIVGLWQAFAPYMGRIPGQSSDVTYGLCCNPGEDGSFEYIAGVEVPRIDGLPPTFRHFKVRQQDYAVFRHLGHISTIHQTFLTIFNKWLPASGYAFADAPEFEQYSADFEPMQGTGFVEVWVPVVRRALG